MELNSEQIERDAKREREQQYYEVLRNHYPHRSQDYEFHSTTMWRLRPGGMIVRSIEHGERVLADRDALSILDQPGNCDELWLKAARKPAPPIVAKTDLDYQWESASPIVRELLRVADVASDDHQRLLLALARIFSMKPIDFPAAGEPAKCAARFFLGKE
jgi:hypothetical protein